LNHNELRRWADENMTIDKKDTKYFIVSWRLRTAKDKQPNRKK